MSVLDRPEVLAAVERARAFSGWAFDGVDVRPLEGDLPWDYEERAREALRVAGRALDLGTGGGEVFSRMAEGAAAHCFATEEWGVNAAVAAARLGALGIPVVRASSERLPFADSTFDVVLSRHEAIEPAEIDRVLGPGGTFLTQQVCPEEWPELRRFLPRATVFPDHWTSYQAWFRENGYAVEAQRRDYRVAFGTLADLVFMLMVSAWSVPDFDAQRDGDALLAIEEACSGPEGIILSEGRYLLAARKPGGRGE